MLGRIAATGGLVATYEEDADGDGVPDFLQEDGGAGEAGAYTPPLFSSTLAVSDTKYTPDTPGYSLTPSNTP